MPLFLIETRIDDPATDAGTADALVEAAADVGARLVEARHTTDRDRLWQVYEHDDESSLSAAIERVDTSAAISEVRLVGATVAEVRTHGGGNFITEWDFPEGLTMDAYLARKTEKSPLYDEIPEVEFKRTYVKENLDGCVCVYDADCTEDVLMAREKVDTPVDRIAELE